MDHLPLLAISGPPTCSLARSLANTISLNRLSLFLNHLSFGFVLAASPHSLCKPCELGSGPMTVNTAHSHALRVGWRLLVSFFLAFLFLVD